MSATWQEIADRVELSRSTAGCCPACNAPMSQAISFMRSQAAIGDSAIPTLVTSDCDRGTVTVESEYTGPSGSKLLREMVFDGRDCEMTLYVGGKVISQVVYKGDPA